MKTEELTLGLVPALLGQYFLCEYFESKGETEPLDLVKHDATDSTWNLCEGFIKYILSSFDPLFRTQQFLNAIGPLSSVTATIAASPTQKNLLIIVDELNKNLQKHRSNGNVEDMIESLPDICTKTAIQKKILASRSHCDGMDIYSLNRLGTVYAEAISELADQARSDAVEILLQ